MTTQTKVEPSWEQLTRWAEFGLITPDQLALIREEHQISLPDNHDSRRERLFQRMTLKVRRFWRSRRR